MKIKKARRIVRAQIAEYAKQQFDEYAASLRPGFLVRLFRRADKWRAKKLEAFVRWQNRRMKRLQKRAERRVAYAR